MDSGNMVLLAEIKHCQSGYLKTLFVPAVTSDKYSRECYTIYWVLNRDPRRVKPEAKIEVHASESDAISSMTRLSHLPLAAFFKGYQTQAVYRWEWDHVNPKLSRVIWRESSAQALVTNICRAFGKANVPVVTYLNARYNRSWFRATQHSDYKSRGQICISSGMNTEDVIVHETVHALVEDLGGGHGPEFVWMYVNVLEQLYGFDRQELELSLIDAGVECGEVALPTRKGGPIRIAPAVEKAA